MGAFASRQAKQESEAPTIVVRPPSQPRKGRPSRGKDCSSFQKAPSLSTALSLEPRVSGGASSCGSTHGDGGEVEDGCISCASSCDTGKDGCTDARESWLHRQLLDVGGEPQPWGKTPNGCFTKVRKLQDAARNSGSVDLMKRVGGEEQLVAVKCMPNWWMGSCPEDFAALHPGSTEKPWNDIAVTRFLHRREFQYVCEPQGVFRDAEYTYVVSSFASGGDLFSWCDTEPRPGNRERESVMRPIVSQIFSAVQGLHELGIAHRDLSLENILLTPDNKGDASVKIIDFGMATIVRCCPVEGNHCGKKSYQAPEMNVDKEYDTFLADYFALGVVLFCLAAHDYPWMSTRPECCRAFDYARSNGLREYLKQRRVRGARKRLAEAFSEEFVCLIEGLLWFTPDGRLGLGEKGQCGSGGDNPVARKSVWDMEWLTKA